MVPTLLVVFSSPLPNAGLPLFLLPLRLLLPHISPCLLLTLSRADFPIPLLLHLDTLLYALVLCISFSL